jgi:pimeloyl-CoA dehydrogenase small subunit
MDFDLNDDQRLLKDSVDRLIEDQYGDFEKRKAYQREPHGWSERLWAQYAELGLLALPFEESAGGFGGGPVETMILMEAFGRGLALEPYLATVVLGGGFLRLGGSEQQRAELIPRIAEGAMKLAFAQVEPQSRFDLHDVATKAQRADGGWTLQGSKSVVLHGDCADRIVVSARTGGGRRDRDGISLFLVDPKAEGVAVRGYATQDGMRAAEVQLSDARVGDDSLIGEQDRGLALIERVVDGAIAALCAEAVGAMEALHQATVGYLKDRKQFGVSIGSFQALQHRAVDMMIALEQARSMEMYAAMMADAEDAAQRRTAISAAKVQVNQSARFVSQQAVQLHGGIGMTMEYRPAHHFKRLTMIESQFGDTEHHLRIVAGAGGLIGTDASDDQSTRPAA